MAEELILRENNPYSIGVIFEFDDGDVMLEPGALIYTPSENDKYYTITQGETIWGIAHKAYGDSKQWWKIAMVNELTDPFELEGGITLVIPDLELLRIQQP